MSFTSINNLNGLFKGGYQPFVLQPNLTTSTSVTFKCNIISTINSVTEPITNNITTSGSCTVSTSGNYKLYTFTSGYCTFTTNYSVSAETLVVGGGGNGGSGYNSYYGGSGGGGGGCGIGELYYNSNTTYNITVGNGASRSYRSTLLSGSNSTIIGGSINETAYGGGNGVGSNGTNSSGGSSGGSSGATKSIKPATKGTGQLTYYGNSGGFASSGTTDKNGFCGGGGGGGAGGVGGDAYPNNAGSGGNGGAGITWFVNNTMYGGGGGGGTSYYSTEVSGYGGTAYGGAGKAAYYDFNYNIKNGYDALPNTGGGGGGGVGAESDYASAGGSGVVIIAVIPPLEKYTYYTKNYTYNTDTKLLTISNLVKNKFYNFNITDSNGKLYIVNYKTEEDPRYYAVVYTNFADYYGTKFKNLITGNYVITSSAAITDTINGVSVKAVTNAITLTTPNDYPQINNGVTVCCWTKTNCDLLIIFSYNGAAGDYIRYDIRANNNQSLYIRNTAGVTGGGYKDVGVGGPNFTRNTGGWSFTAFTSNSEGTNIIFYSDLSNGTITSTVATPISSSNYSPLCNFSNLFSPNVRIWTSLGTNVYPYTNLSIYNFPLTLSQIKIVYNKSNNPFP